MRHSIAHSADLLLAGNTLITGEINAGNSFLERVPDITVRLRNEVPPLPGLFGF